MKRITLWPCLILMVAVFLISAPVLPADEFAEHMIAAKAGVVNYVEGEPLILGSRSKVGRLLVARTQVKTGERIETNPTDRLELLLNPGSYLRLGPASELRVIDTDFGAMHFEVVRGTVIVESATFNQKVHALKLSTPTGDVVLLKEGLYRVDVGPEDQVEVLVHKGKASWVKEGEPVIALKSGKRFNLAVPPAKGAAQYAALDKNQGDVLDRWSQRRAKFLVAANSRLSPGLLGSVSQSYGYNLRGGWVYNRFFNCYTFLPFDGVFGSPYGYTYGLFYPVRTAYYPRYEDGWARSGGGSSGSQTNRNTSSVQRSTVASAPSAPASRTQTGGSERGSRSGTFSGARGR